MKKTSFFIALIATVSVGYAQEATLSSGGDASGSGGSSSYSVGQVVYTTNTGSNGSMAQGVQQPYEISTTTGIEVTEVNLSLAAYPNPATSHLNLSTGELSTDNLSYQLYNNTGAIIQNQRINSALTTINMEELPKAIYFVKVIDKNEVIKTFKIIKN